MAKAPLNLKRLLKEYSTPLYYLCVALIIIFSYRAFFVVPDNNELVRWSEEKFSQLKEEAQIQKLLDFKKQKTINFTGGLGTYSIEITPQPGYFAPSQKWDGDTHREFRKGRYIYVNDSVYFRNSGDPAFVRLKKYILLRGVTGFSDHDFFVREHASKRIAITSEAWDFLQIGHSKALDDESDFNTAFVDASKHMLYCVSSERNALFGFHLYNQFTEDLPSEPVDTIRLPGVLDDAFEGEGGHFLIIHSGERGSRMYWMKNGSWRADDLKEVDFNVRRYEEALKICPLNAHYLVESYYKSEDDYGVIDYTVQSFDKDSLKRGPVHINNLYNAFEENVSFHWDDGAKKYYIVSGDLMATISEIRRKLQVDTVALASGWGPYWHASQGNKVIFKRESAYYVVEADSAARKAPSLVTQFGSLGIPVGDVQIVFPPTRKFSALVTIDWRLPSYLLSFDNDLNITPSNPMRFDAEMVKAEIKPKPYVIFIVVAFVITFGTFGQIVVRKIAYEEPDLSTYLTEIKSIPALQIKIIEVDKEINDLRNRYNAMLFLGLTFGILGIGALLLVLEGTLEDGNFALDGQHIIQLVRVTVMLIFIETLAFFFLRQYRVIYNEYKLFYSVRLKLLSYVSLFSLSKARVEGLDRATMAKIIDQWLSEEIRLYTGELSAANDYPRAFKEILEALAGKAGMNGTQPSQQSEKSQGPAS
ncbi:MAG TPA: hypothetical protein VIU12_25560 [Chryseolinea sp.]